MDFAPDQAQAALRDKVIRFAREHLGANVAEHDRHGTFDEVGWKACAEFGVLGWPFPREYGGGGLDPSSAALAYEALGYGCVDNGLVFAVNNHVFACAVYVADHGTPEQRREWLPRLCDGTLVGAHALSEPGTGSDMLALRTTAVREGDHYRLDGVKTFISNAPRAGLFVVFARTGDEGSPGQNALTAFIVPRDTPGLGVRLLEKAGLRGTLMGEVTLDGVRVPATQRLGAEGAGYRIFTAGTVWERGFMFASGVGLLARLVDRAVEHATTRQAFGRPIGAFQAVSHRIADMRVRLELSRLLLHKVAWMHSRGMFSMHETSMLKLYVSESLTATALEVVQIHGARGYTEAAGVERELRDVLAGTIYAGTSEIQRSVIAGLLGLPTSA